MAAALIASPLVAFKVGTGCECSSKVRGWCGASTGLVLAPSSPSCAADCRSRPPARAPSRSPVPQSSSMVRSRPLAAILVLKVVAQAVFGAVGPVWQGSSGSRWACFWERPADATPVLAEAVGRRSYRPASLHGFDWPMTGVWTLERLHAASSKCSRAGTGTLSSRSVPWACPQCASVAAPLPYSPMGE